MWSSHDNIITKRHKCILMIPKINVKWTEHTHIGPLRQVWLGILKNGRIHVYLTGIPLSRDIITRRATFSNTAVDMTRERSCFVALFISLSLVVIFLLTVLAALSKLLILVGNAA